MTANKRIVSIISISLVLLTLVVWPGQGEVLMPYIISEGVQRVAADNNALGYLLHIPKDVRPEYIDVLTFADLVAHARAKARRSVEPTDEDYFIGMAWTCLIPWSPPKPKTVSKQTRRQLKTLIEGAYTDPAKRDAIMRALKPPLLTLSREEMERKQYDVSQMLNLSF